MRSVSHGSARSGASRPSRTDVSSGRWRSVIGCRGRPRHSRSGRRSCRRKLEMAARPIPIARRSADAALLGALGRTRTADLPLRRRLLYPLSYQGVLRHFNCTMAAPLHGARSRVVMDDGAFSGATIHRMFVRVRFAPGAARAPPASGIIRGLYASLEAAPRCASASSAGSWARVRDPRPPAVGALAAIGSGRRRSTRAGRASRRADGAGRAAVPRNCHRIPAGVRGSCLRLQRSDRADAAIRPARPGPRHRIAAGRRWPRLHCPGS